MNGRLGVLASVLALVGLLGGCTGDVSGPAEAETELTAPVVEVFDEQAFTVATDAGEPLLVLTFAPVQVEAGDMVVVVGELHDFDPGLPEQLEPPVATELLETYEGERVLVASQVHENAERP